MIRRVPASRKRGRGAGRAWHNPAMPDRPIIPAIVVLVIYGDAGTGPLLLLSQVILSLQLPFAVFPLITFTGDRAKMGKFVAPFWMRAIASPIAFFIAGLNGWMLFQMMTGAI